MVDPSHCLIYKGDNGEIMWFDDYETLVEQRDQILKDMTGSIGKLYSDCPVMSPQCMKLAFSKDTKGLLEVLNEKGRQIALINAKLNCSPMSPNNPTINDAEYLLNEKDCLSTRMQFLEKVVKESQNHIYVLNRQLGDFQLPRTDNVEIQKLIQERNLRIQVIANAGVQNSEMIQKKTAYQNQVYQRQNLKVIFDTLNMEISNYCQIINFNRTAMRILDDRIRSLDALILWNLMQVDEDTVLMCCKKEMHEKKIERAMSGIAKIKARIGYINCKFIEFNNSIINSVKIVNQFDSPKPRELQSRNQQAAPVHLAGKVNEINRMNNGPYNSSNVNLSLNRNHNTGKMFGQPMCNNINNINNGPTGEINGNIIQNRFNAFIESNIREANSQSNSMERMYCNFSNTAPSYAGSSRSMNTADLLRSISSTGISPCSSQNDSDNARENSPTNRLLHDHVDSEADNSDEVNGDIVLRDLDKEIERAIHQVEAIIIQGKDEVNN